MFLRSTFSEDITFPKEDTTFDCFGNWGSQEIAQSFVVSQYQDKNTATEFHLQ